VRRGGREGGRGEGERGGRRGGGHKKGMKRRVGERDMAETLLTIVMVVGLDVMVKRGTEKVCVIVNQRIWIPDKIYVSVDTVDNCTVKMTKYLNKMHNAYYE